MIYYLLCVFCRLWLFLKSSIVLWPFQKHNNSVNFFRVFSGFFWSYPFINFLYQLLISLINLHPIIFPPINISIKKKKKKILQTIIFIISYQQTCQISLPISLTIIKDLFNLTKTNLTFSQENLSLHFTQNKPLTMLITTEE